MIFSQEILAERNLRRVKGARDKKVYVGPKVVALDINNSCNLTCQYCWTHAPGNPEHFAKPHFFSLEKFFEVVRDCVELEVDQVDITGQGEPTMHPSFREMMRYVEDKPITTTLYTNATFPPEYCSDVIRCDHIIVDLSAVNREQYLEVQGKDLFDRVIANIKRLVSLRDESKPGFIIEIVYILNILNVNQKNEMLGLASKLGVPIVDFKKMNTHAYNKEIALPDASPATPDGEDRRTPPMCLNGWFYLIAKENTTSTCCRIRHMKLGSLTESSLKEIWSSQHMMNMRLLGRFGQIQKMFTACQTCPYYVRNIEREKHMMSLK